MALGDDYIARDDLKERLRIDDTVDDAVLDDAITGATEGIRHACGRDFAQAASATARRYKPSSADLVITHDISTTTGLVVETDEDDDGTFETTISSSDYELEPIDGFVEGETGWPYWKIRLVDGTSWPRGRRHTIQVTARWGWSAIPGSVTMATFVLAEDLAKLRDTAFGVGGFGELGRVRARENPHVANLIGAYRRAGRRLRVAG